TNLRTGSERLRSVGPPVAAHRMLRSSPEPFWVLPEWPSTLRCIGGTGNENLRQRHFDGGNLHRDLFGVHGPATGECELATDTREAIRRALPDQRPQGAVLVSRYV